MAKNPVTASERRGIAALGAVTLLIVSAGFLMRGCGGDHNGGSSLTPETVILKDTTDSSFSSKKEKKEKSRKKGRKKSGKGSSAGKKNDWSPRQILEDTLRKQ